MSVPEAVTNQLLTAAVGAFVGAAVAFAGGWLRQIMRERERRRSLATVMLQELRSADASLRQLYGKSGSGRLPEGAFPLLDRRDDALELFSPDTVKDLIEVTGMLAMLRDFQGYAGGALRGEDVRVRAYSYAAILRIPQLKQSLENEGAESVRWEPVEVPEGLDSPTPPDPPPSPF